MTRSKWKFGYIHSYIWRCAHIMSNSSITGKNFWLNSYYHNIYRKSIIPRSMVGSCVWIHRGGGFKKDIQRRDRRKQGFKVDTSLVRILCTSPRMGTKFGEYTLTRKPHGFIPKKKKQKKR